MVTNLGPTRIGVNKVCYSYDTVELLPPADAVSVPLPGSGRSYSLPT